MKSFAMFALCVVFTIALAPAFRGVLADAQPPVSAHAQEGVLDAKMNIAHKAAIQQSGGPLTECFYEHVDKDTSARVSKTTIPLYLNKNLARRGQTYAFVNEAKGDLIVHVNWAALKPQNGTIRVIVNIPVK